MSSQRHDGEAAVGVRIQAMLRKENDYLGGLKENNDCLAAAASILAHDSTVSGMLEESKLQEYRDTVKRLALQNVTHHRQVQAYLQGLQNLQAAAASLDDKVVDYTKILKESMNAAYSQIEESSVSHDQDDMYMAVSKNLNEPKTSDGADDDEIAVIQGGGTRSSLKCPITCALMENPMKNKVCGHVYEKHAILVHIRNDRLKNCPVTGCRAKGITEAQLEEDRHTATLIRRQKIRDENQRKLELQSQNAIDMDDVDEE